MGAAVSTVFRYILMARRGSPSGILISFGITFLVFGISFYLAGLDSIRLKRKIENTPTSKARSVAMGLVEIYGEVVPWKETFTYPLSDEKCVLYYFSVTRRLGRGRTVDLCVEKKESPFFVKDETGMVLVDPAGAKFDLDATRSFYKRISKLKDLPDDIKRALELRGVDHGLTDSIFSSYPLDIYSVYLCPGDRVYVMGTATDNPFVAETRALKGVEDVIIKKGEHDKNFFISQKSERELLAEHLSLATRYTFGGAILVAIGLLLIILAITLGAW
ncbi:MAG: GIDE domain-containing protein [Candidatus Hadarchaeales archaeon]